MSSEEGGHRLKPVTLTWLQRATVSYLERYGSSSENLRRVLRRKAARRAGVEAVRDEAVCALIDDIVATAVRTGLVDDRRYAEAKAATLRRRGASASRIAAALSAKGIEDALVRGAVAETGIDEFTAARRLACRRRLGPWRTEMRDASRERDMAVLARAGFSFNVIRRVIDGQQEVD